MGPRDVTVRKAAASRPRLWVRFARDRQGTVALAVAVLLPVLIGFAGIGIEVGMWFAVQRQNQSAADAAAISAALEYAAQTESGVLTDPIGAAAATANYNLFSPAPPNTLNLYPCYGFTVGNSCNTSNPNGTLPNAVQVVLTQPLNTTFANLVTAIWGPNVNTVNVTTTAIAAFPAAGTACFLALDPAAPNAVLVDGTLSNPNCWVGANSSSGSALNCNGCTIAGPTTVVGGDTVSNGGQLKGSPNRTYASAIADPYASVSVAGFPPPGPGCTPVTTSHITHGHYCGIQLNNQTLWMDDSGVYYIDNVFSIQNGSTLNAQTGVTIVINGNYCIGDGTCQPGHGLGANSTLNVTAQSTGPLAGIAIFGPRNSKPAVTQEFAGNSQLNIQGAIYFPSQTIQFDSNSQLSSSFCTQIIGAQIHIENGANVSSNCSGTGITPISILEVYLSS